MGEELRGGKEERIKKEKRVIKGGDGGKTRNKNGSSRCLSLSLVLFPDEHTN